MPTYPLGNPPIRDSIVDTETGKPVTGFAKWLSTLAAHFVVADNSANSTVTITSATAIDLATVITLANEIKADLNVLITETNDLKTKLRAAGVMA